MRKIESEAEIERRKKRNNMIISLFLLGILVLGTLGFAFSYNLGDVSSGLGEPIDQGIEEEQVIATPSGEVRNFNGQEIRFSIPLEFVTNIRVDTNKDINNFAGKSLYFSGENQAVIQELRNTIGLYATRVQEACYGPCKEDLPEISCNGGENLIVWKSGDSKIYEDKNCIFIDGDLRAVDAFLYKVFGFN